MMLYLLLLLLDVTININASGFNRSNSYLDGSGSIIDIRRRSIGPVTFDPLSQHGSSSLSFKSLNKKVT